MKSAPTMWLATAVGDVGPGVVRAVYVAVVFPSEAEESEAVFHVRCDVQGQRWLTGARLVSAPILKETTVVPLPGDLLETGSGRDRRGWQTTVSGPSASLGMTQERLGKTGWSDNGVRGDGGFGVYDVSAPPWVSVPGFPFGTSDGMSVPAFLPHPNPLPLGEGEEWVPGFPGKTKVEAGTRGLGLSGLFT